MQHRGYIVILLALSSAVWAQGEGFVDGEDEGALESRLADFREPHRFSLRWRVKGSEVEAERLQLYQRLEWKLGTGTEFHLLTERDPGESRWADFASFYLHWRSRSRPMAVVLGDLRPGWGSGLVCGRGSGRGGVPLSHPGVDSERVGYRSSGENGSLRGIAWRYVRGGVSGMAIGGQAWRDARTDADGRVTSLPESGYHVSAREEEGRRLLQMDVGGGRLLYRGEGWSLGGSMLAAGFDHSVDLRRPERKEWAFGGDGQQLWATDGEMVWRRMEMRGEMATDGKGKWGMVVGMRIRLGKGQLRGLVRRYDPGFYSLFGGAPSRGGMENEQGYLIALERRGWSLYVDRYRRPSRTYYYPLPSVVSARGGSLKHRLGKGLTVRALYREDRQPRWREERSIAERSRRMRVELECRRGKGLLGRLRLEGRRLDRGEESPEFGWLIGMLGRGGWRAVNITLHCTRFRTDSYGSRLYEYEYDLPGMVSVRPLYGKGWRGYALVGLKGKRWSFNWRYRLQLDGEIRQYGGVQIDIRLGV